MTSHIAHIERANRKDLEGVEVQLTITDASAGRQSARACAVTARRRSSDSAMRWPPHRISVESLVLWNPKGVIEIQRTPMAARARSEASESADPYPWPGRIACA